LGLPCWKSVGEVPDHVGLGRRGELLLPRFPSVIEECVRAEVSAAVVISAGFRERGTAGTELEREIQRKLRGSKTRLLGPNCLGVMNPLAGMNATFAQEIARPGSVAFLSQSGALLTAILDWSLQEDVGFSAIVSTGSMLDIGWGT